MAERDLCVPSSRLGKAIIWHHQGKGPGLPRIVSGMMWFNPTWEVEGLPHGLGAVEEARGGGGAECGQEPHQPTRYSSELLGIAISGHLTDTL